MQIAGALILCLEMGRLQMSVRQSDKQIFIKGQEVNRFIFLSFFHFTFHVGVWVTRNMVTFPPFLIVWPGKLLLIAESDKYSSRRYWRRFRKITSCGFESMFIIHISLLQTFFFYDFLWSLSSRRHFKRQDHVLFAAKKEKLALLFHSTTLRLWYNYITRSFSFSFFCYDTRWKTGFTREWCVLKSSLDPPEFYVLDSIHRKINN